MATAANTVFLLVLTIYTPQGVATQTLPYTYRTSALCIAVGDQLTQRHHFGQNTALATCVPITW